MAPAMADYLSLHPDVSIELALNDRFVDLVEEGFDVAIRVGQLPDSTLIARRLVDTQTVLCASPDYLEKNGEPRTVVELAKHNCLVYPLSGARGEWRLFDRNGAEEAVQVSGRFVANSGDALRVLGLRGQGIVRLPLFIVGDDLAAGRLVRLLPLYEAVKTPVHAVYPHGQFLSAKVRSFVAFLAARFAQAPVRRQESGDARANRASRRLRVV